MIGVVHDLPRTAALKKVFAAFRSDTTPLLAKAYMEGLADVPDAVLVAAIDAAIQGEAFMPTVARIRTYADKVKPARPELPPAAEVQASHYLTGEVAVLSDDDPRTWSHCTNCRDTGWVEEVRVGRPKYTMPLAVGTGSTIQAVPILKETKSYFSHCHCRATNPKLVSDRQRTAKYSREAEK